MRKHLKHLKNEKGLTLVELLVVIVILGIVAAIAVVAVGNIVEKSRVKAEISEAVQILNAAKLKYTNEGATGNEFKKDDLVPSYLDNVKSEKDFKVNITKTNDSVTFSISGHDANGKTLNKIKVEDPASLSDLSKALNTGQ
ncbi:MAG TPA: prepilin-type N-terminal cleavage/methylation domain-containing protein [Bacilli bacterium]|nr:prepilin-type N-terminal cleavage/methylation domain-containing protein [Bacilli bacterium]